MSEVVMRGVRKSFQQHVAIDDLNLHVASGSTLALLGPSGSGKTTLLRLLCGFERCDAGAIVINDTVVSGPGAHLAPERRRIGYVPQEGALFPHLSVADNIVFGLNRQLRRQRHRVIELLEMVGLSASFADRTPQQLSGGQQQRVAVARALAPEPAVVLLDEPFSALDTALRNDTRQAVIGAIQAAKATAILVTHDQSEALSLGKQVAVLWRGTLLQQGTPRDLYCNPRTLALATFLGESIVLPGHAHDGLVACELGQLPVADSVVSGEVEVLIRPEQIEFWRTSECRWKVRIVGLQYFGYDATLMLELDDSKQVVKVRTTDWRDFRIGEAVCVTVKGPVRVFPKRSLGC